MYNTDMYNIIKKVHKKYKSLEPIQTAKNMNAKVIYADLGDSLRGFYQYFKRGIIICINNRLTEKETAVVLAHEIGHAILHRKHNRVFMDKFTLNVPGRYENEANLFAAYMLISDEAINEYISCEYTIEQIAELTGIDGGTVKKRIDGYFQKIHN